MHSPFGALRHHLARWEACHWIRGSRGSPMNPVPFRGGTITRAYCRAIYEESVSRCFILPPLAGEVRRSRIGGGERSEPISRMLIIPYDIESQSRNADFILIARRAIRHLQRRRRCRPLSGSEHNPSTQPAAPAAPFFIICGEAATTTLGLKGHQT